MTATSRIVDISCDGPDGLGCPRREGVSNNDTSVDLLAYALEDGWRIGPGRVEWHLCPTCAGDAMWSHTSGVNP